MKWIGEFFEGSKPVGKTFNPGYYVGCNAQLFLSSIYFLDQTSDSLSDFSCKLLKISGVILLELYALMRFFIYSC